MSNEPMLSLIIPCWNDVAALAALLQKAPRFRGIGEVVVADASPTEECRNLALLHGARVVQCPRPSRGEQLNAGARLAHGPVLLFHHADTELTQAHVDAVRQSMSDPAVVGGAFHRKFDERHPRLRWLERIVRALSRFGGTLYGDQSVFIRREVFEQLGGFAAIPLMEDVEFSGRLRRSGRVVLLDPPIASSPRHHRRRGAWQITFRNAVMLALYRFGFSPEKLHAWYYRRAIHD